jgi:Cu(I)/Ag(I) efflux system membrane fusion protein
MKKNDLSPRPKTKSNRAAGTVFFGLLFLLSGPLLTAAPALAQTQQQAAAPEKGKPPIGKGAAKKEAPAPEAPAVEIPADKQKLIGVRTVPAALQSLGRTIRTVGRIEADERRSVIINTKVEGWIEKLHVNYTGSSVKAGQPLAEIYSPELLATQQEYLNVLKWKKGFQAEGLGGLLARDAEAILDAARERLRLWDISDDQIQRLEETGKPIRALTLYSSAGGVVTQKFAVQGMRVMAGERLFEVTDLSQVWIVADLYEGELPLVKIGDRAAIKLSYLPGQALSATVDYIYPTLSGDTRTAKVRFTLPNPQGKLKPQMYTEVELGIHLGRRLAVPGEALLDTGVRQVVYVDKGDGNFEPRTVTTGLRAEKWVEILKGLKAGEKVAASANFLIDSEAKLKGIAPR